MSNIELPAINQRVKEIIEDKTKGNVTAFSLALGYTSAQKVNRLFKIDSRTGKYPVPSSTIISDISNMFDVNTNWLVSGTGNKYISKQNEAALLIEGGVIMVPLVNQYAHAGYLCGYADAEYIETLPTIPFIIDKEADGNYIAFEVKGDSMDDGTDEAYKEGDRLLCREIFPLYWIESRLHIRKWDFVIVHEEGILVKRIIDHDVENHTITIHSLNTFYPDRVIDLVEVRQIFKVVELQRTRRR